MSAHHSKKQKQRRAVRSKSAKRAKSARVARPMYKLRASVCTKLQHDFDASCFDCQLQKNRLQLSNRCKDCRNLRRAFAGDFCEEHSVKVWRTGRRSALESECRVTRVDGTPQDRVSSDPNEDGGGRKFESAQDRYKFWADFDERRNRYLRAKTPRVQGGGPRVAR